MTEPRKPADVLRRLNDPITEAKERLRCSINEQLDHATSLPARVLIDQPKTFGLGAATYAVLDEFRAAGWTISEHVFVKEQLFPLLEYTFTP